jgi:hypothetical protein
MEYHVIKFGVVTCVVVFRQSIVVVVVYPIVGETCNRTRETKLIISKVNYAIVQERSGPSHP